MSLKKPQCLTCHHNIQSSSCGSCATKGTEMVKRITEDLGMEISVNEEDDKEALKHSCKIIMRYPEDFNNIDPYNCIYYLSAAFSFR